MNNIGKHLVRLNTENFTRVVTVYQLRNSKRYYIHTPGISGGHSRIYVYLESRVQDEQGRFCFKEVTE